MTDPMKSPNNQMMRRWRWRSAAPRSSDAELIATLAHDLRTPLSGVLLNLELLRRRGERLSGDDQEDVAEAITSAKELAEMIEAIVDIDHAEKGTLATTAGEDDLASLVQRTLDAQRFPDDGPGIEVEVPTGLRVRCDPKLTGRVVAALVRSALAVTSDAAAVTVRGRAGVGGVRLEIEDGGTPIPVDFREEILDSRGLLRAKTAGVKRPAGFMLVFARLAVEAQGGRLGLLAGRRADPARGNTVWLELPGPL